MTAAPPHGNGPPQGNGRRRRGVRGGGRRGPVLVVDDEASIRKTLEAVLRDEGFDTRSEGSGDAALAAVESFEPAAVLLDIWMPGTDGIETLRRLRARWPDLPVVMMSGHASIATAVEATKCGAAEFVEKPLDLDTILGVVRRLTSGAPPETGGDTPADPAAPVPRPAAPARLLRGVFSSDGWRGRRVPERTIRSAALLYGQGLHSGKKSGLVLEPLPAGSGVHFVGLAGGTAVPAHVDFVGDAGFATTIRYEGVSFGTIEHLMSALHAYGVTNLLVKCNGEVPVMDGSAREFCELLDGTGIEEQGGELYAVRVPEVVTWKGEGDEWIRFEPCDRFEIDYTLSYPEPVGTWRMTYVLDGPASFARAIAPCRTFGFVRDVGRLQKQGLALGGRFDNFVLIGEDGPINDSLRFPDEFVRHKILDAIGDLYLLGRPFEGKVTASMTGHSDNVALLGEVNRRLRRP